MGIDPIGASSEAAASLYKADPRRHHLGAARSQRTACRRRPRPASRHLDQPRARGAAAAARRGLCGLHPQPRRARPADRPGFHPRHLRDRRSDRAGSDALVREMATDEDIAELERVQSQIEDNNFADPIRHSDLDTEFHTVMYQRHYNRHAAELWWKHREVLRAVSRRFNFTLARRRRSSASIASSSRTSRRAKPTRRPNSWPATSRDPAGTSSSICGPAQRRPGRIERRSGCASVASNHFHKGSRE